MGGTIHIRQGRWLVIINRLDKRSRMNREIHVRNCVSVGVKFPCATRLTIGYKAEILASDTKFLPLPFFWKGWFGILGYPSFSVSGWPIAARFSRWKGRAIDLKKPRKGARKNKAIGINRWIRPPLRATGKCCSSPGLAREWSFLNNGYCVILRPSITVFDSHPLHFSAAVTDLIFGKSKCWICYMQGYVLKPRLNGLSASIKH